MGLMKSLADFSLVWMIGLNLQTSVQASSPGAPCLWMGPIQSLNSNARFQRKSLARTFKQSRHEGTLGSLLWVEVIELLDTQSRRSYQLNVTREDAYDGGNTLGWIEEVTDAYQGTRNGAGQLVAWINDGEMSCVVESFEPEKNENE
jgi:hypothetical protein